MMKAIDAEGGMGSARKASRRGFPSAKQAAWPGGAVLLALALAACSGAAGNGASGVTAATNAVRPAVAAPSQLVGLWHQASPPCASGAPPPATVEELEFEAGGRFLVTFVPFETYHDYWGPYRYDAATGALTMTAETGNAIPADLDLEGRATLAPNGELVVEGIYFGSPHGAGPAARDCILRFTRRR